MPSVSTRPAVVPTSSLHPRRSMFGAAILAAAALPAIAHADATFTPLGTLGGTYSYAAGGGLSAAGDAGAGGSSPGGLGRAYRWTPGGGMANLDVLPGMTFSNATGISADGAAVTGVSGNGSVTYGFHWTGGGGMTNIGLLSGANNMYPGGISGNGNIIVGNADQTFGWQKAFRWQNGVGLSDLGYMPGGTYARASAVTADGNTIFGYADTTGSGGDPRAFSWTSGGGFVNLGTLPGGNSSYARGASDDGVAVGQANNSLFQDRPVVFSGGLVNDLGMLAGFTSGSALDASLGGASVVGGVSGSGSQAAFLWTSGSGMVNLNTYLPTLGIDLTGWDLKFATSISADGTTIMGYGTSPDFFYEAWVATIPSPSLGAAALAFSALAATRRRRPR